MRTRAERRESAQKEYRKRMKLCKEVVHAWGNDLDDYIKHKTDIPHSQGSNWWNAYETKSMNNKRERLKQHRKLKNIQIDDEI